MIAKIIEGKSFFGCVAYVLKKDSEIIQANGLRTDSAKTITQDFNFQRMMNPRLGKAVGHVILSWNTADKNMLTNDVMVSSAMRYLSKIGVRNTQYLMVRHHDRRHDHIHIIFNRVNDNGKTISNSNQRFISFKTCKELNALYGFKQSKGKEYVNQGRLRGSDKIKYQIYDIVKAGIRNSSNWAELQNYIRYGGIEMQLRYKSGSSTIQGILFSKSGQTFPGSAIDRSLSFSRIDKSLNFVSEVKEPIFSLVDNSSMKQNADDSSRNIIGEIASSITLLPAIAPDTEDPSVKKKRKKQNYGQKR